MSFLIASSFAQFSMLPFMVFVAEVCVVTLSTIRTICVTRGRKGLAAALGFFEVSIWLFAIGQIMQNLSDISCYLAFASGFSLGNFLGVIIEKKLALGNVVVQITTHKSASALTQDLKAANFGVTMLDAQGATGPVQVVFTVIKRRQLGKVVAIIKNFDPKTFYAVNDLQTAAEGISLGAKPDPQAPLPGFLRMVIPTTSSTRTARIDSGYEDVDPQNTRFAKNHENTKERKHEKINS